MNRIIRWYNKNRKIFWLTIVVVIIVISVPRALNEYAKSKKDVSSSVNNTTIYSNKNYSIISEKNIEEEKNTKNTTLIDEFIKYCNNGNIKEAYEILSNECKELLYPTLNDFKDKYYNNIFQNKKSYDVQAWFSSGSYYTYKINLKEDILSTGNVDLSSMEDYYTIVYENNNYKLNINSYIGNVEINKSDETDEVKISVLSKDIFMDYEIYNINVENRTGKSVLLDSLENTNNMYLEDSGELRYDAYSHELVVEELRVRAVKDISIKFNKKYTTEREIEKIVFSDIILDYDTYTTYNNKPDYKDRIKMEIEL